MKEKITTLELGKCYQIHHDNDVLHLIRVNEEHTSLIPNIQPVYMVAEIWGDDTINTNTYHSVTKGSTYTEITQEQFKNVLNSMIYRVSNHISTMN